MNHRIGIYVSAVVALLGSLLLLATAGLMLALPYIMPAKAGPFPPGVRAGMYLTAGLMLAGAAWGIATSIGLFRCDRWSRISILVFSCLMAATCLLSLVVVLLIPLPAPGGSAPPINIRALLAAFYGSFIALGVIWAVYFTRVGVKAEFGATAPRTDPRPLSIVIIGWWLVVSSFFVLPTVIIRFPAYLLGLVLGGWRGTLFYLLSGALCFYVGRGLLRLDRRAYQVGVGYFVFAIVNSATILWLPERFALVTSALPSWLPQPAHAGFVSSAGAVGGMVAGLVSISVPLFFVIRNRAAFAPSSIPGQP